MNKKLGLKARLSNCHGSNRPRTPVLSSFVTFRLPRGGFWNIQSNFVPPDHLCRNDLSVDESRGESFFQAVIQWLFYLGLVSSTIQRQGLDASTFITFESLRWSSIFSTSSLTWGQFKVWLLLLVNHSFNITVLFCRHTFWPQNILHLFGKNVSSLRPLLVCIWALLRPGSLDLIQILTI